MAIAKANSKLIIVGILVIIILSAAVKPATATATATVNPTATVTENFEKSHSSDFILPTTGFEPVYEPNNWNSDPLLLESHNCYAYFLDDIDRSRIRKPQPGYIAISDEMLEKRNSQNGGKYSNCDEMIYRIKKDNPSIYIVRENEKCNRGYYKGFLTIDPGKDYHFYRQDSNGYFSHKRGREKVENVDSMGNSIINPRLASKSYGRYNYTVPCSYMCIPSNSTYSTLSTS